MFCNFQETHCWGELTIKFTFPNHKHSTLLHLFSF
jgi:hypothetical protein